MRFARCAALPGLLALCALPATASASSGGFSAAALAPASTPTNEAGEPPADHATVQRGELAGLGTWIAPRTAAIGRPVKISGRVHATLTGRTVRLQRQTPTRRWQTVATSRVRSGGRFTTHWRTRAPRNHDLRLVLLGIRSAAHAAASADTAPTGNASASLRVAVLARSRATWFGPGSYGSRTACGLRLTQKLEGVAHRTLPCGTKVEIRLGSRSTVLPVVDRGPFANGADFDLTKNVADGIGLRGVATVRYAVRLDLPRISTPYRAPAINR